MTVRRSRLGAEQFEKAMREIDRTQVRVGFFEDSKYDNGTQVAYVAAIHEMGAPSQNIPPRPFIRPTINHERHSWAMLFQSGCRSVVAGRTSVQTLFDKLGMKAGTDVMKTITKLTQPALKPATIRARINKQAKRGFRVSSISKPLVDSGVLLASVQYEVSDI